MVRCLPQAPVSHRQSWIDDVDRNLSDYSLITDPVAFADAAWRLRYEAERDRNTRRESQWRTKLRFVR
jgi:hypothetical protein